MYQSRQERMQYSKHLGSRQKLVQNKPNHINFPKDYEDEQTSLAVKGSDSADLRDLKNKMKLVMTKLSTVKKEKETVQKENKVLQEEVITLQSNLRQMVAGFSNTSSNFPINNEIGGKFAEFYKYECLDMFFDVLSQELNMKGIIVFFCRSFSKIKEVVEKYFQPSVRAISETGCFDSIEGPIMNVLRKAYQTTYKQIFNKIQKSIQIDNIVSEIQYQLSICDGNSETNEMIRKFLVRVAELNLYCKVSDPPFEIEIEKIGQKIGFNPLIHDPFDGFIKPKQDCWVVLPSVRKTTEEKELTTKSLVLQVDYDLIN